ncbi:MAG: hypothetical protein N4A49_15610, partial [Marinifilaceae bacterium]|nr:hypothetical protein [Marinifilaceae bacterium]
LEESNYTDAELEYYDRYWDMVSTEKTLHRELQEKALKKGLEQGLEQGMEKGIEQSIIEMYKNKLPIPDIAKYLNKDQVYVEKVIARYLRNKPL